MRSPLAVRRNDPALSPSTPSVHPNPAWTGVFEIVDSDNHLVDGQALPMSQVSNNRFRVEATLRYLGETGLGVEVDHLVRELPFDAARRSDLASVPAALGWFERPHGAHTPAALFHDDLLVTGRVPPADADLLFRFMLKALGVPTVKRYLMWAGVALRTQWVMRRPLVVLWALLSVLGLTSFVLAAFGIGLPAWLGSRWVVLAVSAVAPLPASLLWGREWRAALVAAVMAIWVLPAGAIALVALAVYGSLERIVGALRG